MHQLVRILDDRFDFNDELIVTLIRIVFPQATRSDGHARIGALLNGIHGQHRGREIGHVQTFAQHLRDRHLGKIDHQCRPLLLDVDSRIDVGEVHRDPSLAILAAPEGDVANAVGSGRGVCLREMLHRRRARRSRARHQGKQQAVAIQCCLVGHCFLQVEDEARAVLRLDDVGTLQIALVIRLTRLAEAIGRVRKIKGHARRSGDTEGCRQCSQGFLEGELDVQHRALLDDIHRLNRIRLILCIRHSESQQRTGKQAEQVWFDVLHLLCSLLLQQQGARPLHPVTRGVLDEFS
ncbi:MAG: hypothetical protein AW09_001720 [Candidatus Accumulibacter phosphatis]|uniref:Uncharacterized protein n=1 Tax=Candidatus Accumulibacter phosphatis TaxID=327160 RepID=A0A080LWK6_9PROT|nr:MAG: hypothetical protein AW09_001720 [Candidatus Accumulibacter phosphatis]